MNTPRSDPERERLLARIVRAAAAVVDKADHDAPWGVSATTAEVVELAAALDALPLAERVRYGV